MDRQNYVPPSFPFKNKNYIPTASVQLSAEENCRVSPMTGQHKGRKAWLPVCTGENCEMSTQLQNFFMPASRSMSAAQSCFLPSTGIDLKNILLADLQLRVYFLGNLQHRVCDLNRLQTL